MLARISALLLLLISGANATEFFFVAPIPVRLSEEAVGGAKQYYPGSQEDRWHFIRGYADAYLDSCRYGSAFADKRVLRSGAGGKGYEVAKKTILAGGVINPYFPTEFGYTTVKLTGAYTSSAGSSEFIATNGEKYHLNPGLVVAIPTGKPITINAYLSPVSPKGFGYRNQWKQELIVINIAKE